MFNFVIKHALFKTEASESIICKRLIPYIYLLPLGIKKNPQCSIDKYPHHCLRESEHKYTRKKIVRLCILKQPNFQD